MLFLCNPFITSGQALIAGTGTFTVLGREALFNTSVLKVSEAGSFALSGQAADFRRNLIFEAAAGAIALDGQIVTMIYGKGLLAEVGAFALTGNEASVLRDLLLKAGTGSFTVTGEDADFVRHLALAAEPGLFSLSGQTAGFRAGVNLGAEAGLFTLSGQEASIARGAVLQASAGAYALNGQGVTLARALRLAAATGSFAVTGQDAGMNYVSQASYTFIQDLVNPANSSSYAFTTADPLAPGVYAIAAVARAAVSGPYSINISSVSIGAETAEGIYAPASYYGSCSAIAVVDLGTASSSVSVGLTNGAARAGVAIYRLDGLESLIPVDQESTANTSSSLSRNINAPEGGVVIAGAIYTDASGVTWSGVTEQYDRSVESTVWHSGGAAALDSGNSALPVGFSGGGSYASLSAISLR